MDARDRMIDEHLRERGITDERVLSAFARLDRAQFLPQEARDAAYADHPISIGYGQTISQPYIVAYMLQALDVHPEHRVLEIGSGTGFVVALLTRLCKRIVGCELVPELIGQSMTTLARLELEGAIKSNYSIRESAVGAPDDAPFDRILVSAAPASIPQLLVDQLAVGGVMILPVGVDEQWLYRVEKTAEGVREERLLPVMFVRMV